MEIGYFGQLLMLVILMHLAEYDGVSGQGRMLYPPGRSTMWRVGYAAPANINDNLLSCGGVRHRWTENKGRCGVCGDPWDSKPRDNEAGGLYSNGIITSVFTSGSHIKVKIDVAIANGGYFEFRLCVNNDFSKPITKECLDKNKLVVDGSNKTAYKNITSGENIVKLKLPDGVICDQCVLQWKYRTADQHGCDVDESTGERTCGFGFGEIQSEYYACADIAICSFKHKKGNRVPDRNKTEAYQIAGKHMNTKPKARTKKESLGGKRSKRFVIYPREMGYQKAFYFNNQPYGGYSVQPISGIGLGIYNIRQKQLRSGWDLSNQHIGIPRVRARRRVHENRRRRQFIPNIYTRPAQIDANRRYIGRGDRRARQNPLRPEQSGVTGEGNEGLIKVRRGEMFPGSVPEASLVRVEGPTVQQVLRPEEAAVFVQSPPVISRQRDTTQVQNTYMDPLIMSRGPKVVTRIEDAIVMTHMVPPTRIKTCQACPFDQCLDKKLDLDKLFPGLFEDPVTFLDCPKYEEKMFTVGKFKVLKEGLPECSVPLHPRFKRQSSHGHDSSHSSRRSHVQIDDDDWGCCGTRPQVILPLTVDSDNDTFKVVQLQNDRSQFLVQGICGRNRTSSCSSCKAEDNFQWVLVYDGRVNSKPPVSFVPVKFPHYCRCYNIGRPRRTG